MARSTTLAAGGSVVNGKLERLPGDGCREALELYTTQRDDLYAGRTPRTSGEGLIVGGDKLPP